MKPNPLAIATNIKLLAKVNDVLLRAEHAPARIPKQKIKELRKEAYKARRHAYAALDRDGVSRKKADARVKTYEEGQRRLDQMDREMEPTWRALGKAINKQWRLMKALEKIMPARKLKAWLTKPNPAFGGKTPYSLVQSGEHGDIWKMIRQTRQGAFA